MDLTVPPGLSRTRSAFVASNPESAAIRPP